MKSEKEYLKSKGWVQHWNDNNWVKEEWFNKPNINIDWAGMSTQDAYRTQKRQDKADSLPDGFVLVGDEVVKIID